MKYILTALIVAALTAASPMKAEDAVDNSRGRERPLEDRAHMTSVSLGENSKLTALPSERDQIRRFYRDVLGCPQSRETERADFFRIGATFNLGVVYDDKAPSAADGMKSIWLELRTAHPEELKQKILAFGIKEIQYWDKEHFYFQAPGGQVFRLAGSTE